MDSNPEAAVGARRQAAKSGDLLTQSGCWR
jgi:hypothetical protein